MGGCDEQHEQVEEEQDLHLRGTRSTGSGLRAASTNNIGGLPMTIKKVLILNHGNSLSTSFLEKEHLTFIL